MKKNTTTRRTFLRNVSAAAAVSVVPTAAMALDAKPVAEYPANERKGPKRGVSLYSYSAEFGLTKTLEDCFEDIHDMGATGNRDIGQLPYRELSLSDGPVGGLLVVVMQEVQH